MKNFYVDITELAAWQGKLTGVPRVMHELCVRFVAMGNAQFIKWDSLAGSYELVEIEAVLKAPATLRNNDQANGSVWSVSKLNAVMKNLLRRSSTLSKAASLARKKVGNFKAAPPARKDGVSIDFHEDDVLFVLCDWHGSDPAFVDTLVSLKQKDIKLAHMAYDILPIVTPQFSGHATDSLTKYSKAIYPLCDIMFSISKNTKGDITNWLSQNNLSVPLIEVIRLGDDFQFAEPVKPTNEFFKTKQKFILCVGTIEARKNHTLLYYTYKLATQQGIDLPDLVIVGRRGWKTDDIYELLTKDPETKERFIIQENTSDEELSWLYDNCLFSIYPSFYEGWGLPIAESASRGVPCICSNTSSMPEVAGDYVKYFSPYSANDCLAAITLLLDSAEHEKIRHRLAGYKPVSWDHTFDQVNSVTRKLRG